MLDELVNFGIFEKLDEKIGTYLGTSSVEEFYGILLRGYEADFGEPFVKHILSLIAVSRNGLSEEEILAITKEMPLHWSQFFCAIRQHLIFKNGLISFAHSYIRKAVVDRYLREREECSNACRKEIVSLFNDAKTHRAMDEVPYQYDKLGDLKNLHDYLMDLDVFKYLNNQEQITLGKYWSRLICEKEYSLADYMPLIESLYDEEKADAYACLSIFTHTTIVNPPLSTSFIEKALKYVKDEDERVTVHNQIGRSFVLSGNLHKGLKFLKKALLLAQGLYGESHYYVAASYINLSDAYGRLGDYQTSLKYEEKAKNVLLFLFSENHPAVAALYNNVGYTYGELGKYQTALEYHEKALRIRQSLYGENHPDIANSYNNIGFVYTRQGDYNKALDYLKKALEIRQTIYGENHPDISASYNNIGVTYGSLGNHQKAIKYEQKALKIRRIIFGDNHPFVAKSYDNLGYSYGRLGEHRTSLEYEEKALKIWLSLFGENHPDVATLYTNVGYTYGELREYRTALEYHEKALRIRSSIFGENHPHVAISYNNIGNIEERIGNFAKGIEQRNKALEISVRIGNDALTAILLNRVGRAYKAYGQREVANGYFRQAAEKYRELGDEVQAQANLKEIIV